MKPRLCAALLLWLLASPILAAAEQDQGSAGEPIQLLASIRPLALIARDLLGDGAEIDVLVTGAASPHDYALKVSDMRRLRAADLVLWMGPELERFLVKALRAVPEERVLALGAGEETSHGDHDHGEDLHQWLDPRIAREMAGAIAQRLVSLMPEQAHLIQQRLEAVNQAYDHLHGELQQTLGPVSDIGFVVQHRGYDFFVSAYGLNQQGWLSVNPEQPPGARHVHQLQRKLGESTAPTACLFVEKSHAAGVSSTMAAQLKLRLRSLDILGVDADSYSALMRRLASDVADCLSAQ